MTHKRIHRLAVSSFFFLAGLCFFSWASRIPDIRLRLRLDNAALGAVLLALPVGLMVSLPLAGWLVARFGSRRIATIAAIGYACTLPLLGLAAAVWQLMGCLFLFGMGGNLLNISMNTQAVGTEQLYGRTIMASYHGLWSLAGFSGAAVGNLMIGLGLPPYLHFLLISALALGTIAIASGKLIPHLADTTAAPPTRTDTTGPGAAQSNPLGAKKPIFAMPDRSLISLGLIAFCSMICEGSMFDWSGVYFQKVIQPPREWLGAGLTAFTCTMAAARFIGDWMTTKWGIRTILQASGLLTAVGLLTAIGWPGLGTGIGGFLLVGAGVSSVVPLVYSAAGRSKRLSPGVALAAVSTIGYLGFLFGPPFIGFIAQASSLRVSLGLIAILGSAITLIATRTKFQ
ncbi:MAG: MFS transporter [Bacteroidota bacterium]|nr:MFS transporter [Bacteroidota bacterium]MDP4253052.1 MFS transporter [Bacteroidota bacterium]MDP4259716.1 MFS transporter [Bacteroidota bacterium]